MSKNKITEYVEELELGKSAQFAGDFVEFAEDVEDSLTPGSEDVSQFETVIEFDEPGEDLLAEFAESVGAGGALEDAEVGEPVVVEFAEEEVSEAADPELEADPLVEEVSSAADSVRMLPGSTLSLADDDDEPEEVDDSPGTWRDDGDVRSFMEYISRAYDDIPAHKGDMIGSEVAINYLKGLDREISKALTLDKNYVLDAGKLDGLRVNMMNDMMTLKNHIKKLQRKIREQHGKKASDGTPMKVAGSDVEFTKEATVARPQLVITPFERAISGMIVNAVVSSGKSFEDVYEVLKEKYAFTNREELAVMQLVADMGYPIFKDRGSIGEPKLEIDFMRSYFY